MSWRPRFLRRKARAGASEGQHEGALTTLCFSSAFVSWKTAKPW